MELQEMKTLPSGPDANQVAATDFVKKGQRGSLGSCRLRDAALAKTTYR